MNPWLNELSDDLHQRRRDGLLRTLGAIDTVGRTVRVDGRERINLAGNDYLALARHPHLVAAVTAAAQAYGIGAGASRLITGTTPLHMKVEQRFAAFKHAQAALICPTGYMANHAVVTALSQRGDCVCADKLNHASLIDAAHASGATVRIYPHKHYDKLARLLARHRDARRRLIITDSVFSMDGDCADLPTLCDLADEHDAILIVDEAHGTGVLGATGAGLCEQQGVADRVDVVISTASKAMGGLGGIVTAKQVVIDTLVNHARSLIYTTAAPPTQVAAIDAALDVIRDEPQRRQRLRALTTKLRDAIGLACVDPPVPIVPVIVGDCALAIALSQRLRDAGFHAPAIRPPTVAPGAARVRISLRSDLEDSDIDRLIDALVR
jgi:8-amino-7-oxononanoate synthase